MANTADEVRSILREIREDGRASFTHIAEIVDVPRQIVASVVDEAIASNKIRLTATINPEFLGINQYAYVLISVSGPTEPILNELNSLDQTCFVSALAGTYGVDAEIRTTSDEEHQQVLGKIRGIPGVSGILCNVYSRILVNIDSPLPVPGTALIGLDQTDRRILAALEQDGRATFRELSDVSGVSPAGARNRVQRLLQHQVIKIVGLPVRDKQSTPPPLGIGIRVRGEISDELIAEITSVRPEFLAISSGSYDLIATLSADDPDSLFKSLDALRAIHQVTVVDAWSHLRITKEAYGAGDLLKTEFDELRTRTSSV